MLSTSLFVISFSSKFQTGTHAIFRNFFHPPPHDSHSNDQIIWRYTVPTKNFITHFSLRTPLASLTSTSDLGVLHAEAGIFACYFHILHYSCSAEYENNMENSALGKEVCLYVLGVFLHLLPLTTAEWRAMPGLVFTPKEGYWGTVFTPECHNDVWDTGRFSSHFFSQHN